MQSEIASLRVGRLSRLWLNATILFLRLGFLDELPDPDEDVDDKEDQMVKCDCIGQDQVESGHIKDEAALDFRFEHFPESPSRKTDEGSQINERHHQCVIL